MSMNLSIYVGPYLEIDRSWDFDGSGFDNLLSDGRNEAAETGEPWRLIPYTELPGIDRQIDFDRFSDCPVVQITTSQMDAEKVALKQLAEPVFKALLAQKQTVRLYWGIVPCWS